jgi:hypothetical protein
MAVISQGLHAKNCDLAMCQGNDRQGFVLISGGRKTSFQVLMAAFCFWHCFSLIRTLANRNFNLNRRGKEHRKRSPITVPSDNDSVMKKKTIQFHRVTFGYLTWPLRPPTILSKIIEAGAVLPMPFSICHSGGRLRLGNDARCHHLVFNG